MPTMGEEREEEEKKRKRERNRDFNTLLIHFSSRFQTRSD
jgi:hypothetical protein